MNNRNIILKYLSDLMEEGEKTQFEEQLKTDTKLKEEFDQFENSLNKLNSLAEIQNDSSYFNNLVPIVRNRIEVKKQKRKIVWVPAISFAVTLLIFFMLQFPKSTEQNSFKLNISSQDLMTLVSDADSSVVNELMTSNFIDDYAYLNTTEAGNEFDVYLDDSFVSEVDPEDIGTYYNVDQVNNYSDLSEDQVNTVYEELINKKIL